MVSLILVFCLTANPKVCINHEPPNPGLSWGACPRIGQVEAHDWLAANPAYRLAEVRCQFGSRPERAA